MASSGIGKPPPEETFAGAAGVDFIAGAVAFFLTGEVEPAPPEAAAAAAADFGEGGEAPVILAIQ